MTAAPIVRRDPVPVLALDAVTVQFPDGHTALHQLSLTLARGERVALLGANGSGKTTCLQVLAGVRRPTSGTVSLHGVAHDFSVAQRNRWRRHVGMVLADVDDQLIAPTVRDDVAFGVRNSATRDAPLSEPEIVGKVQRVLDDLAIGALADRAIHSLSLGERRRVALAGILVMQPDILLLDEPTVNLDRRARHALRDLLVRAATENRTVCLATHDTTFAWEWATRAVVLESGSVLADDSCSSILRNDALLTRAALDPPRQDIIRVQTVTRP